MHTFGVRRIIAVLDSENQPRSGKIRTASGALVLTEDVWHQKYANKKEGFNTYLNIHSIDFKNSRFVRGTSPGSGSWPKPDPHPCFFSAYTVENLAEHLDALVNLPLNFRQTHQLSFKDNPEIGPNYLITWLTLHYQFKQWSCFFGSLCPSLVS